MTKAVLVSIAVMHCPGVPASSANCYRDVATDYSAMRLTPAGPAFSTLRVVVDWSRKIRKASWSHASNSPTSSEGMEPERLDRRRSHPPSAPEPGIYAAADFSGQFENDPIYCGYLAWHRSADGSYRIIREEENIIDKGTIAKMGQTEVKALAAKVGCTTAQ